MAQGFNCSFGTWDTQCTLWNMNVVGTTIVWEGNGTLILNASSITCSIDVRIHMAGGVQLVSGSNVSAPSVSLRADGAVIISATSSVDTSGRGLLTAAPGAWGRDGQGGGTSSLLMMMLLLLVLLVLLLFARAWCVSVCTGTHLLTTN